MKKKLQQRETFCPDGSQNLQKKRQIVSVHLANLKEERAARKILEEERTFVKAAAEKEAKEAMRCKKEEETRDAAKCLFEFGATFI